MLENQITIWEWLESLDHESRECPVRIISFDNYTIDGFKETVRLDGSFVSIDDFLVLADVMLIERSSFLIKLSLLVDGRVTMITTISEDQYVKVSRYYESSDCIKFERGVIND